MGKLFVIAGSSGPFADFGPYAASINDRGMVAFQATRRGGETGVFCGDGGGIAYLHKAATFYSHPDINNRGALCAYAELARGRQVVLAGLPGPAPAILDPESLLTIGPLGPTINSAGVIAFRATSEAGHPGIFVAEGLSLATVAEAGGRFSGFEGLPVIIDDGTVFFRADHADGGQGIYTWQPGNHLTCVVTTGERIKELGRFPSANASGTVAFTVTQHDGTSGIFKAAGGRIEPVIDTAAGFESFRGALIDDAGRIVFYATPQGGALGIYALEAATPSRLIGLGAEMLDTQLTEFALNPVSLNNTGQIAVRLKLADGQQFIARMEAFAS